MTLASSSSGISANRWSRALSSSVGEQDRAVGERRGVAAHVDELVAHALDRADVLHVVGQLGRLDRVVDEVHPVGGGEPVGRSLGDDHRVVPTHAAFLGDDELDVGPGVLQLDDVAGPRNGGHEVTALEAAQVLVAGERPDLTAGRGLVDEVQRLLHTVLVDHRGIVTEAEHDQPEGVAHLAEQGDAALELGVEQIHDAAQLTPRQRRVVGEPGDAGLPRQAVDRAVVPGLVEETLLEVDAVGDPIQRERFDPPERLEPGGHPVGGADDVVVDHAPSADHRLQDAVVDLVVVVEVLAVRHGDARGVGEPVDGSDRTVLGGIDVGLPVEDPHLGVAGTNGAADRLAVVTSGADGVVSTSVAGHRQDCADDRGGADDTGSGDEGASAEPAARTVQRCRPWRRCRRCRCRRAPPAPRRRRCWWPPPRSIGRATCTGRRVPIRARSACLVRAVAGRRRSRPWRRPRCRRGGRRAGGSRCPGRSRRGWCR